MARVDRNSSGTRARDQGRVAASGILGDTARYARGTWYNSAKLMDIEYTTAGLVNLGLEGERNWFFKETGKVRSTTRIVTQDDLVVGFNMLGRRWDHSVFIRWIEERRTLAWVLRTSERSGVRHGARSPASSAEELRWTCKGKTGC